MGYALAYAENAPRYAQNTITISSGYSGDMLCLDMFWDMLELLHDILQVCLRYAQLSVGYAALMEPGEDS